MDMSNKQSSFHHLFQKAVKMKKRKPRQGTANLISTYLDESHLDEPFAIPKRGRNEGPSDDSDSGLFELMILNRPEKGRSALG